MSSLPGNPYCLDDWANGIDTGYDGSQDQQEMLATQADVLSAQVDATLALAHEQRMATLATLFSAPADDGGVPGIDYGEAARQLTEGLGLGARR